MSEYEKQAEKFLKDTKTTFKAEFLKNGKHFDSDDTPRDIYLITLTRLNEVKSFIPIVYKFDFGQSINNSDGKTKPSVYDVLACLTSCDPDTFKEFCSSYGYDEDSRKAEAIYKKVVEEWKNIKMLWTDEEIQKLQEIN